MTDFHANPVCDDLTVRISVGFGDFLDRLTILDIKSERIQNVEKNRIAKGQLDSYQHEFQRIIGEFDQDCTRQIAELKSRLKDINCQLWEVEDDLRAKEATKRFDDEFVMQARRVYLLNDKRAEIKAFIDNASGSAVSEVKEHLNAP
jgi:hypothetical protein